MTTTQALRQALDWIAELPEEDQPDEWTGWKLALLQAETQAQTALQTEVVSEQRDALTASDPYEKPHLCNAQHPNCDMLCALPKGHEGRCWVYVRANAALRERSRQAMEQKRREAEAKKGAKR